MRYLFWLGGLWVAGALGAQPAAAQALALSPCNAEGRGPRAECGSISVWENPVLGAGRRIPIHFAVLRAEHPAGKEPVFAFAGGPGVGSTSMGGLFNSLLAPVRKSRDIVLVDQRGTGGSNPLVCAADIQAHPELAFGHVFDPALFLKCRAELEKRADLRLYTSELAARDIDEIRSALHYEKVIVMGGSYGTRLAQVFMRNYPERVTAAVLDGVVPFDYRAPALYATWTQQALDRLLADCQAAPVCSSTNPDVGAAFERLITRLHAAPVATTVQRSNGSSAPVKISAGDFAYAVRGILYSTETSRLLPGMIRRADSTGDLHPFAQRYWERALGFSDAAIGLHFSIYCAEDTRFISDQEAGSLGRNTFVGGYLLDEYRNVCRDWPLAELGPHARDPVTAPIPTLLTSGWFDPVTPSYLADQVAAKLPNHRHILVRDEGHGSGYGCALPATLYVLVEGKIEGSPTVCEGITNLWRKQ